MKSRGKTVLIVSLLLTLAVAACAQPAATPTTAPEPTETPMPAAEEPEDTATPAPTAEPTATPEPEEEPTAEPQEEPTAEPEEPTEAMAWAADGTIEEGEYTGSVQEAGVTFHWATDGEFLYGALAADTEGWVAVGFRPETRMQGANFVYGYVVDGEATVYDMFGVQPVGAGSHPPDTEIGGTDNIVTAAGQEMDGQTVIEFQIPLETDDENDKSLTVGETHEIILAHGTDDDLSYHAERGQASFALEAPMMEEDEQAMADMFPELISLPNGFQPEGIAVGAGTGFYVGSIPTGAIYKGDLETGEGEVFVQATEGRQAIGLYYDEDSGNLFVAGGPTGQGYVYDGESGELLADLEFTTEGSFVNDVVATGDAAYFTDSSRPYLYRVPLEEDGMVAEGAEPEEIELTGDYEFVPDSFNANGIAASADGNWLIVAHSQNAALYRVDPQTGEAMLIDLGDESVPSADGILLDGQTLYVVQNRANQIALIELDDELTSGTVEQRITNPDFRVPTTVDAYEDALYAVNARFGTEATKDTEYNVVRVPIPMS
jgi:sugar lactone lactonase YvrE